MGPETGAVEVRAFVPADVDQVIDLNYAVYRDEYGFNEDFLHYARHEVPHIARSFDPAKNLFLVAAYDAHTAYAAHTARSVHRANAVHAATRDRVVGSIIVVDGAGWRAPGFARLQWFAVAPECRGRGLGKLLAAQAVAFARTAGYRGVWLRTLSILPAAAKVYQGLGFRLHLEKPGVPMGGTTVTEQYYELVFKAQDMRFEAEA